MMKRMFERITLKNQKLGTTAALPAVGSGAPVGGAVPLPRPVSQQSEDGTEAVPPYRIIPGFALLGALLLGVTGCGRAEEEASARPERVVTVETQEAQAREWQLVARAVGSLTADEQVQIRTEVAGFVRSIHAAEGDTINEGDILLQIDDERARLEVKRAEARHEEMQANLDRRRPLFEKNLITEAEMIEAESNFKAAEAELGLARRRLADTTVRAPIDGTLGRRYISRGDYAEVGTRLFDLVKIDRLKLDFELPERYLPLLRAGQHVRVRTTAYPDRVFEGEVYFVDPLINIATRTVPVRAWVDNEELFLRPNLFVSVSLDVTLLDEAVVVPEESVISDLGGYSIYVVDEQDRAQIREVRIGEREPGWVQVVEGVEAGERVVAAGHQRLQPGLRVTERNEAGE